MQHARLPMPFVRRNTWLNLAIDVAGIVKECFKVRRVIGVCRLFVGGGCPHAGCRSTCLPWISYKYTAAYA